MRTAVAVVLFGVALVANNAYAQIVGQSYVYSSRYALTEFNGAMSYETGAMTARSFTAAGVMGAIGMSNVSPESNWEDNVVGLCRSYSGSTLWPESCSPLGMATTLNSHYGGSWGVASYLDNDQSSALSRIINALWWYGSPVLVPLYGQADHWVAIKEAKGTYLGNNSWTFTYVKFFDGGAANQYDSGYNSYWDGAQIQGTGFINDYYKILTAINPSCDPNCSADPFWHKFILMYDPPHGAREADGQAIIVKAPGIVAAGEHMNTQVAQRRVMNALRAASVDDIDEWPIIQQGQPGPAWRVEGTTAIGTPWNYYLVPVYSDHNMVSAFVQLADDDGGFESVFVPRVPVMFTPISLADAAQLARDRLASTERLRGGKLVWDARARIGMAKAPHAPYYEFEIVGPENQDMGVIRVALGNAAIMRSGH